MKQQRGSLTLGLSITIAILSAALAGTGWLYNGALKEKARVEGEYEAFKAGVKDLGEKAEAERIAELERQRQDHDKTIKSLEARAAAARARADQLCKSAGLSAGCSSLSAVPPTTRPADDTTRDQRLLAVLRHAQDTADGLIELQNWLAAQKRTVEAPRLLKALSAANHLLFFADGFDLSDALASQLISSKQAAFQTVLPLLTTEAVVLEGHLPVANSSVGDAQAGGD